MALTDTKDFKKMMEEVRILRKHYSELANMAEEQLIIAQIRGETAKAAAFKTNLDALEKDHKEALALIADNLTSEAQLRAARKAIKSAKDTARGFVEKLKETKLTLDKLTKAAKFLAELLTDLRKILV